MIEETTRSTDDACAFDHRSRSLTSWFFFGAAIGAGLAVFLAPAPGRDIRAGLAAGARRGRERASETIDRGRAAIDRTRAHARDQRDHLSRAVREGREAVSDIRARSERALEAIGQEAAGAVADVKTTCRGVRADLAGHSNETGV